MRIKLKSEVSINTLTAVYSSNRFSVTLPKQGFPCQDDQLRQH